MGLLQEAQLARLGSRFSLNFRPAEHRVNLSPMGRFYDIPVEMGIGVRLENETYILPFADIDGINYFSKVEQEFLIEGIEFRVRNEALGIDFGCKLYAPFYPGDQKISSAPFFYLDLSIRSFIHGRHSFEPVAGEWFFCLAGLNELYASDGTIAAPIEASLAENCWYNTSECPPEAKSPFSDGVFKGEIKICPLADSSSWFAVSNLTNVCLSKPFRLESAQQVLTQTLIIAAYQSGTVLKAREKECSFLYTRDFPNIDAVLDFACSDRKKILEKTALFTGTVTQATVGEAAKSLIACGFQNYLVNTWWVLDDNQDDHFLVWEGWCAFHSTLDVEYNNAWFALLYWPELLEKQLKLWYTNLQSEGFPSHDLGILLEVNKQVYPHHMPVEESCNLILLTYAMWRFRGYLKWHEYLPELIRVVKYLLGSDTTGNGYPNLGVANTVDDAAATVQYAKEQTYLAVKVFSALTAFSQLMNDFPESETLKILKEKSAEMIAKIRNTMETIAWLGDHYAVCLPQSAEDLRDVWTGRQIEDNELNGWNAYSLYTTNGLLFLLATGIKPDLNYDRLLKDLETATDKSLTSYGCTHSSIDRSNVWLSQNMWRDQIAGYLGIDYTAMMERYWNFLVWENTQGRGGCYVDTYGWNWLSYYPRGITAFGILASILGMQINAAQHRIELAPVKLPCRLPLVVLADWEAGNVPWIECRMEDGKVSWRLEGQHPDKWQITLPFGREVTDRKGDGSEPIFIDKNHCL